MCGISGFINPTLSLSHLLSMQNVLNHRGPDAKGHFFENGVGLAHNRLSIIDLSHEADQPFKFEDLVMVFNGEIYNFTEIREDLVKAGYSFITSSDTEVLIKGFHCWGPKILDKLVGMFAFAVYDQKTQVLYLCRDRLGVKPLYYFIEGQTISFTSELKAFLRTKKMGLDINGLSEYLTFGYTIGNDTFFKGTKKIPPGHYLIFQNRNVRIQKYWDAADYMGNPLEGRSEEQLTDELEELMISSFRYRMVSDVPVGIFFSGGIDSTLLVAILSKHYGNVNTFTIGFDDPKFDETPYAREIARYFKTNHTERILKVDEARKRLGDFYKIYDEPFFDSSGIPTSLVSELAAEKGMKVVLSSEGGDELFAGYPSYQRYYNLGKKILRYPEIVRQPAGSVLSSLNAPIGSKRLRDKVGKLGQLSMSRDWIEFYMSCISSVTQAELQRNFNGRFEAFKHDVPPHLNTCHPIELFMLWDLKHVMPNDFLMKIDRATMYHSIESREPFLDHRLVEFCLRLPLELKLRQGNTKYLLRKVLQRYIPDHYFDRPKMGFSIPLFSWAKSNLDSLFNSHLSREHFPAAWPQLDFQWLEKEKKYYFENKSLNKEHNLLMMWKFLGLMLWKEAYQYES